MIEELKTLITGKNGTICSSRMTEKFMKKQEKNFHKFIMESTNFYLDSEINYSKRIELLLTGVTERMVCLNCGVGLDPNKRGKNRNYCSSNCCGAAQRGKTWVQSTETKKKADTQRSKSNLKKYGYNYNSQRPEIKQILASNAKKHYAAQGIDYNKLDDIDYLVKLYYEENQTLTDISEIVNCYYGTISDRLKSAGHTIKTSYNTSKEERYLANFLIELGIDVVINTRDLIHPYEIDIFVPDRNLAIEYNGLPWHSELFGNKDSNYHLNKTIMCQEKGIKLIHVFSNDFHNNEVIVKSIIRNAVGKNENKIPGRKTKAKEISKKIAASFLRENHLKGNTGCNIAIGLFYDSELVQVTTYGKPRFNKSHSYEVIRSATKINTTVVGGFSKINNFFVKNYCTHGNTIITYADRSISNGNVYEKAGFVFNKFTKPGYYYTKKNIVYSRHEFQKHKLVNMEGYSKDKTEWEIMKENKYDRFWDCGNSIFIYTV